MKACNDILVKLQLYLTLCSFILIFVGLIVCMASISAELVIYGVYGFDLLSFTV